MSSGTVIIVISWILYTVYSCKHNKDKPHSKIFNKLNKLRLNMIKVACKLNAKYLRISKLMSKLKIHNEWRITVGIYNLEQKFIWKEIFTQVRLDTKIIVRIAYKNFGNSWGTKFMKRLGTKWIKNWIIWIY